MIQSDGSGGFKGLIGIPENLIGTSVAEDGTVLQAIPRSLALAQGLQHPGHCEARTVV